MAALQAAFLNANSGAVFIHHFVGHHLMVNPSTPTIRLLIDVAAVPGGAFTRAYENFAVAPFDREIVQVCGTGKY
ncbi:hypothetical protein ABT364_01845 [Massilia sp. SR12]